MDLENCRVTNERPDTMIRIIYCGVLPYGRGIEVRQRFVEQLAKEIIGKFTSFKEMVTIHKMNNTPITIPFQNELEDQDVDTNKYHLLSKVIKYAPHRLDETTASQIMLTILLDLIVNVVQLHNIEEDVIDERDVPSTELLLERYKCDQYSKTMTTDEDLEDLLKICIKCDFFGKAKRLKEEVTRSKTIMKVLSFSDDTGTTGTVKGFSKEEYKEIQQEIDKVISKALKTVFPKELNLDEELPETHYDPIEEIIELILTKVLGIDTSCSENKLDGDKIITDIAVKFIKTLLNDALNKLKNEKLIDQ